MDPEINDQETGLDVVTDGASPEEQERREASKVGRVFREALREANKRTSDEIVAELRSLTQPRRDDPNLRAVTEGESRTVSRVNRHGEPVARLASPTEGIYRRFSEEERKWRTPDSDHWMAEWIRGHLIKDHGRMAHANDRLGDIFGRAMVEGTAGAGGAISSSATGGDLISRPLENVIMIALETEAKMRRLAEFLPMTKQQHNIPTLAAVTTGMIAENSPITPTAPGTDNRPLIAKKAAALITVSSELLEDADVNVVSLLARRAGSAMAALEDTQCCTSNGSAPNVSARITATAYSEATSTELTRGDLTGVIYRTPQPYRQGAVWLVANNVLGLIAGAADVNGRPLFQALSERPLTIGDAMGGVAVGSLLGFPVVEMPIPAGEILFGNIKKLYVMGVRAGVRMASTDGYSFYNDAIDVRFTYRFDANTLDTTTNAGGLIAGITSFTDPT